MMQPKQFRAFLKFTTISLLIEKLPNGHAILNVSGENPCEDFSFDKCNLDPSWIIKESNGVEEEVCQFECSTIEGCMFYIYSIDSNSCQLINQPQKNYIDGCLELGLPQTHSISECVETNNRCKGFFSEDCLFLGDLLEFKENVQLPVNCQDLCINECKYALFSETSSKCYLLSSSFRRCSKHLGLSTPPIDDCKRNPFASTTPAPSTTTPSKDLFKLLVVAGHGENSRLDDTELFNPYTEDNNCAKPQNYPITVENVCGYQTTFCGGYVNSIDLTDQCYEFKEGSWMKSSSLLHGLQSPSCVALTNGSFWIAGGTDLTNVLSSTEIRIYEDSGFSASTQLPSPIARHCISTINSTHLFIAGNGASGHEREAFIIDAQNNDFSYTQLPPMKNRRFDAACGTIKSFSENNGPSTTDVQLIVAGGAGDASSSQTTEIYSTSTNSWTDGPALPKGFEDGGFISDSLHSLIILGGIDEHSILSEDVMELTYGNGESHFEILPGKLQTRRQYFAASGLYTEEDC